MAACLTRIHAHLLRQRLAQRKRRRFNSLEYLLELAQVSAGDAPPRHCELRAFSGLLLLRILIEILIAVIDWE